MKISGDMGILNVQMLGGFFLFWNGKPVIRNTRSSESNFVYLMQLLLHRRKDGVGREMLKKTLFEDREVGDVSHAIRNMVYNAKKKLRAAGLPDVNYIRQAKGVYYWTDEIPVLEDASEFERLCQEAEAETDPERRLELYLDACRSYTGEFLPAQTGVLWVVQEARRYQSMFCACVEHAVQLLRECGDFSRMKELGLYAAQISPLSDWETVTMEALVSLGRHEDAWRLYEDTAELYFREQGLSPSQRLAELFRRLGAQMEHQYEALDDIQRGLRESDGCSRGGYLCPYPVFQGIYHMVRRMMERGGQSVYLMLCIVVDSKGNPMKEGMVLDELTERLGDAIQNSVRRGDAVTRYGKGQYLVLLVNTTREDCGIIQKRINYHFIEGRQRMGIQYFVNSVICSADQEGFISG